MDPQFVQHLRYKLQKRVRRLNSVPKQMFVPTLRHFFLFFDKHPVFRGVIDPLTAQFDDLEETVEKLFTGSVHERILPDSEEEAAAIGYRALSKLSAMDNDGHIRSLAWSAVGHQTRENLLEIVRDSYLEPFYEYVDEHLDDQRAMLTLLLRYKHRCEWFRRNHLYELSQEETRKAEKNLALDLYEYLHNQGLDFYIEPASLSGAIDLIAAQGTEDPLLADAKIFDGNARGKVYLRKAFNQIYTYTQQFNEPFGYLVIYKITHRDLRFSFPQQTRDVPVFIHNHKTIFFLTIDIYPHDKPVSQRSPLKAIEINDQDLISIEESEGEASQ